MLQDEILESDVMESISNNITQHCKLYTILEQLHKY